MEHSDDSYMPGSDSYQGHCPICGKQTYTCVNELCDDCFDSIELPEVSEEAAENFTTNFLNLQNENRTDC